MKKRIVSIALTLALLLGSVSALAADVNLDKLYPVVNETVELSMALLKGAVAGDPDEIWFWKWIEGKSNVHWNLTEIDSTIWSEKKNVLLAGGDYPDVFWGPTFTNNEIMNIGQEGIFIPLNDLIDTYAGEVVDLLAQVDGARKLITCPDGNIYSMPYFNLGVEYSPQRAWLNKKWMDHLGLEIPTTLDELYDVLLAFKEGDADGDGNTENEIPWGGAWDNVGNSGRVTVLAAEGFVYQDGSTTNAAIKDGTACYMPLDPAFKDYLQFMNKCWEAGLMDPDIFTQTSQQFTAKALDSFIGYASTGTPSSIAGYDEENWSQYIHVTPLTVEKGATPVWCGYNIVGIGSMEITDVCKNPEVAMRWMNMLYDPNIAILFQNGPIFGTEDDPDGIGWKPETGTTEPVGLTEKNPDKLGWWNYLCQYVVPRGRGGMWYASIGDYYALDMADINYQRVVTGVEGYWRESNYQYAKPYFKNGYPDVVFYNDAQTQVLDELLTPLNDYVRMMEAKFITGAESFDQYDAFVSEMIKLGADQIDTIYRESYAAIQAK